MTTPASPPKLAPYAVPTLYRQLIKLYIRKFGNNYDVIVRSWKQTKLEFYHYRSAPAEDVPMLIERGKEIFSVVQKGVVPIKLNDKGQPVYKYDKETLDANDGKVEPISAEEALRRSYKSFSKDELKELQQGLLAAGRWEGKLEFDRVPNMKHRRKVKCTDPDPPPLPKDEFRVL